MSWPAEKESPAPVTTTILVASSVSNSSSASHISRCSSGLIALRFSGRLRTTKVTPASRSSLMLLYCSATLISCFASLSHVSGLIRSFQPEDTFKLELLPRQYRKSARGPADINGSVQPSVPPEESVDESPAPFPIMISRAQQCATRSDVKQVPCATARNFSRTLSISARNFRLALAMMRRLRIILVLRVSKMRGVPAFRGAGGLPVGLTGAPRVGRELFGARQALSHSCGGNSLRGSGYYASRKPGCAVSPCRHL